MDSKQHEVERMIFCEICAEDLRIFKEATREARNYEVCEEHFVELSI